VKHCAFCPVTANKLSREHIWDDWLNEVLPRAGYRVKHRLSPTAPFKEYKAKILKEKLAVVCETCNHGWMSELTNEVKKSCSSPILHGTPVLFSPAETTTLAAFGFIATETFRRAARKIAGRSAQKGMPGSAWKENQAE